ncbi:hypothetical protein GCM10011571_06570 [Marinithermofilum abyssi]|uniref:Uncharacterized protein n=1 Tax=Marinithermofilum abyssi TaxID=1571185 RepID=A0A8J2VCI5_9BACL|nr:hypothetical protein GCM10011571_06570 [Marinithermofilum abyssi]
MLFINAPKITEPMAKAMYNAHDVTYDEYTRSLDKQLEVEKARDAEYRKAQRVVTESA